MWWFRSHMEIRRNWERREGKCGKRDKFEGKKERWKR